MPHYSNSPETFWARVDKNAGPGGCWIWTGAVNRDGYGTLTYQRKHVSAHRLAWTLMFGPIPDGLFVLHSCPAGDNPSCVNPAHLFLGTQADNVADMASKGRFPPERRARGDRNGARLHPERRAWGERNGSRLHPESRPRGEHHPNARLTWDAVREIRAEYSRGDAGCRKLAAKYGVGRKTVENIVHNLAWRDGDYHWSRRPLPRGEDHPNTRLTWNAVREIRTKYSAGGTSFVKLAKEYGIDRMTVFRIVHNHTWRE
jgi:hypothetical protein